MKCKVLGRFVKGKVALGSLLLVSLGLPGEPLYKKRADLGFTEVGAKVRFKSKACTMVNRTVRDAIRRIPEELKSWGRGSTLQGEPSGQAPTPTEEVVPDVFQTTLSASILQSLGEVFSKELYFQEEPSRSSHLGISSASL